MNDKTKKGTPKDTHYARLRRAFRDKNSPAPAFRSRTPVSPGETPPPALVRLYGLHTVRAALENPKRKIVRMLVTRNALERLGVAGDLKFPLELVEPRDLDKLTGSDAVHQGVVVEAAPLTPRSMDALSDTPLVVVLDQVTDPHNIGAVMRSAVAFGAGALITTVRHSPQESGVLAKAASGALEHIDLIEVKNLAAALDKLHAAGFWTIGLDSDAERELETSFSGTRLALVLGSEGKGLRQKTRDTVSVLARLPMPGPITSLNVSNAAAVALYAARRSMER